MNKISSAYASAPLSSSLLQDILVIGAGAAGLMSALSAGRHGCAVTLLEAGSSPGRKLVISGGGKANFTNWHMSSAHFVGEDPTFCEYALSRWTPQHMLSYVCAHGIPWEERDQGKLFCACSAKRLRDALYADCRTVGCRLLSHCRVRNIRQRGTEFVVDTEQGRFLAPRLILATGSPAFPSVGATDDGLRLAQRLGHTTVAFRPVLTPLRMPSHWALHGLAGISLPVRISTNGHTITDVLLFTHQGISGPAGLLISCYSTTHDPLFIDFLPENNLPDLLDDPHAGKMTLRTLLSRRLPRRLADSLFPDESLSRRRIAELSRTTRTAICQAVHRHRVIPAGTGGLHKAEAAAGGVNLREVDPYTMESLRLPGLFFAGEVLDIAGHLGGYNLHWAWASGRVAGESAAASLQEQQRVRRISPKS